MKMQCALFLVIVAMLLPAVCGAAGPAAPPAPAFSFDNPPGPRFTAEQKQSQRERAAGLMPQIRKAFDGGAESITILPGDYRFGKDTWGRDGVVYPLEFRGLKRDAGKPFRIIAAGATFWFELPPDQAPHAHFAMGFVDCANITLEGATLDRDPPGCMEGRITQIDAAGDRIEIEASKGTFIPTAFNGKAEQRLIPFKSDGSFCSAMYALQLRGPARLTYRGIEPGTRPGRYWVNLHEKSELLKFNADPAWRRSYGDRGTIQPGDGLCLIYSTTCAISLIDCANLQLINLKNHITKGGVRELGGAGGHLWKNCYFGPRPATCQWQGGDGILTGCMERGGIYDGLTILHTTDDLMDIHGFWGYIEKCDGKTITLQRSHQMPARAGDRLNFIDQQTGRIVGSAIVQAVDKQTITLDRDAGPFTNAIAENPQRQNNGWEIRNCSFIDCYQRLLVQGGNDGVLRDSHFVRAGSCVEMHSNFFTHNEGGICRGISILNNTFEDMAAHPDGVTLDAGFTPMNRKGSERLLSRLIVRGNTFANSGKHAIIFSLVDGAEIANNIFRNPGQPRALAGKEPSPDGPQPIQLQNCRNVIIRGNEITSAPPNNAIVNKDADCENITCEP